ncbi:MAG: hypothetical protein Q9207_004629 [Kuettlingeria erythrocarpa]
MTNSLKGTVESIDENTMLTKVTHMQDAASALRKRSDISAELVNITVTSGSKTVRAANTLLQDLTELRSKLEEEENAVREAELAAASELDLPGKEKRTLHPKGTKGIKR